MTILDRTLDTGRIVSDAARLTDELARRLPDTEHFDLARARETAGVAVHDAADRARESLDQAGDLVRDLRSDVARAVDKVQADGTLEEVGQRLRAVAATTAMRALIAGPDDARTGTATPAPTPAAVPRVVPSTSPPASPPA